MAEPAGTIAKAFLLIEGGDKLECWFNPTEYSIVKANTWNVQPVVGKALPEAQYGGGAPRKVTLNLLFDDSDGKNGDVRHITNKLFEMMDVKEQFAANKNSGRPPMVEFGWGATATFKAVCDNLTVQYLLFRPDGTPTRAKATISLVQAETAIVADAGNTTRQNPTTTGIAGVRSVTVRDGDSLQSIAYSAYGDPTRWRAIAEANGIDDPLRLRRGSQLSIPRLPE